MITTEIKCTGNYLSENVTSFPFANNGEIKFIDKGITGCGGTTLAIETAIKEGKKLILALPTVSSVVSKKNQFTDSITAIYGNYKLESPENIIVCTYDKLNLIIEKLGKVVKKYEILLDEYHTLTRDCSYREVCREIITKLDNFNGVTLMSATPDEFIEAAISDLYSSYNLVKVKYIFKNYNLFKLVNAIGDTKEVLKKIISDNLYENKRCYYMINDIKLINNLISELNLEKEKYHVLASISRKYEVSISSIDEINSNLKPVNFLTAAGFEGVDILDNEGSIYTLVDLQKDTTIFDWQTIQQIHGRCRGSKEYPTIIYHGGKFRNEQLQDIKSLEARINVAKTIINTIINTKEAFFTYSNLSDITGRINNEKAEMCVNPFLLAEYNRLRERYNEAQTIQSFCKYLKSHNILYAQPTDIEGKKSEKKNNSTISFKALVEKVVKGEKVGHYTNSELAKNAINILGVDRIKELGYSKSKVAAILSAKAIKKNIESNIRVGRVYSVKALESKLNDYSQLNSYTFTSKTTDSKLKEIGFSALPRLDKVNGKVFKGFFILPYFKTAISKVVEKYAKVTKIEGKSLIEKMPSKTVTNASLNSNGCLTDIELPLSFATKPGTRVKNPQFTRTTLDNTYKYAKPADKQKQYLISDCYNNTIDTYARNEASFNCTSSLILDIDDHECSENPWTIQKVNDYFKENYGDCKRYIYKTYSYTDEHPSFRVIVPLSSELKFRKELNDVSNFKIAKGFLFSEFQDPRCQLWYYSANLQSQPVEYGNDVYLNSAYVREVMDMVCLEKNESMFVLDNKTPEKAKNDNDDVVDNSVNVLINMINNCEGWGEVKGSTVLGHGDWNDKIWAAAYYCKREDIEKIKDGIIDPLKRQYFEEKLRYKKN